MDERPRMAAALRNLAEGAARAWVSWKGERLELAPVTEDVLESGGVEAIVATRRGYRLLVLERPRPRAGVGAAVFRDGAGVVERRRVRAVVVGRFGRSGTGAAVDS